jgi:hypothetical protein
MNNNAVFNGIHQSTRILKKRKFDSLVAEIKENAHVPASVKITGYKDNILKFIKRLIYSDEASLGVNLQFRYFKDMYVPLGHTYLLEKLSETILNSTDNAKIDFSLPCLCYIDSLKSHLDKSNEFTLIAANGRKGFDQFTENSFLKPKRKAIRDIYLGEACVMDSVSVTITSIKRNKDIKEILKSDADGKIELLTEPLDLSGVNKND